jgi:hypothetical protein
MSDASVHAEARIESSIYLIRGEKVLLDQDLASLYGVATKSLVQSVTRNRARFPADFMFQMTIQELTILRSQILTSSWPRRPAPRPAVSSRP